ncbi:DUF2142 domain-containing protein [Patescibacteria group bacterium]|nr:DUF2142 domain-containing protein [Patescibacteria group bacterium]
MKLYKIVVNTINKVKDKTLLIFFVLVILNALVWVTIVPIWQFPDEQAHFGQVTFVAQKGRNPGYTEKYNLSKEIYVSEQLLGTVRDKSGNNRFTFHPDYKIEYTNSFQGKYEASISALVNTGAQSAFVHRESTIYPILYYFPASLVYKIFQGYSLFVRVYAVRLWSILVFASTVYLTYRIGALFFPKDKLSTVTLAMLVAFQPMMVFANVGVNSDSLGNFLFTLFILLVSDVLLKGLSSRKLFALLVTVFLSVYTKPQFIVMIPVILVLLVWIFCWDMRKFWRHSIITPFFLLATSLIVLILYIKSSISVQISVFIQKLNPTSYLKFFRGYTIPHTYREVLPWYWGIYDWLGVTYPRIVHRIINVVLAISLLGFGIYLISIFRKGKWHERNVQAVFFLIFINLIFYIGVSSYDWMSWYTSGFQLGVQGRYFFPLISSDMLFLLIGIKSIVPSKSEWQNKAIKLAANLMILLDIFALCTVAKIYYSLSDMKTFLLQVSQYKPTLLKGNGIIFLFGLYIICMGLFLIKYNSYSNDKKAV